MPSSGDIRNVSDTALWVATYRAMESERPDAHFRDPFARRLAGERGEAIVRAMPQGRQMAWPMIVRTVAFDEIALRAVREGGADTVVNLAAGLDARPWRLDLPPDLRWVDVDLPDILAYKQGVIGSEPPRCRYEARAVDLRDGAARRALIRDVAGGSRRTLVLAEGLLIYLGEEQVADLARDLAAAPAIRWWVIDLAAPKLLERMGKQWGKRLAAGDAPFRFAPAAGTRFFEPLGWKEAEFRSTWDESARLGRQMPMAWLWNFLARISSPRRREEFRRYSGIVLLERAAPAGVAATPD